MHPCVCGGGGGDLEREVLQCPPTWQHFLPHTVVFLVRGGGVLQHELVIRTKQRMTYIEPAIPMYHTTIVHLIHLCCTETEEGFAKFGAKVFIFVVTPLLWVT